MIRKFILLFLCLVVTEAVHAQRPAQPNFVLIYADDLGWQDPKVYDNMETNVVNGFGGTNVFETPYMDALAKEGVLFTQAYSPQCVCAPSRAAILSGQAPARLNFITVSGGAICPQPSRANSRMIGAYHNRRLEVDEVTLPGVLATNGYYNGHIGKWHLDGPGPLDHHFHISKGDRGVTRGMADRLTGFATTNATDSYQLQDINGNASTNGYAFDLMTQNGLDFLADAVTTHSTEPFFCYFATWLVHAPWHQRTERLLEKYALRMGYSYPLDGTETFAPGQNNPYYAAMVETFDYNLHQLTTFLRNTDDPRWPGHKLIDNTYIFLTSDNGGMENGDPRGKVTDNYPLDEGKIHEEEGGTRVPFIAVGPGIPTNLVSDVMINGLDLMPTILSLAGLSVPDGLDGLDLSPLLLIDPTDDQLVTNQVGEVRDTMYWHFNKGSIRKGGWKLFYNYDHVNNSGVNEYRLYRLYDTNGVSVDIEEMVDLWNVETNITEALGTELKTWLVDVGANTPFYNPNYAPGTLPNQGVVPKAIRNGRTGDVVWVDYETNQAEVVRVDLLYTRQGFSVNQQWFRMPANISGPGRAEVTPPTGTTHYVFNLIDENNFMVSYPDVGTSSDGIPDSALAFAFADPIYVNPGPRDTLYCEDFSSASLGTGLTRDSVGFHRGGGSAWEIDSGKLSNTSLVNNSTSEGSVAVIMDLSSLTDPTVSEFTLSFDYTMAEYTETLFAHVWGYIDHSSSPNTAIMNQGAQNGNTWEIAHPTYMYAFNFGNPNGEWLGSNRGEAGDAAVSLAGFSAPATYTRTFDLSGYTTASNTLGAYDYLVLAFTRSIAGSAPAVTLDNVKVTVPTSDPYVQWAYDTGLDAVADNSAPHLNTVTSSGLNSDDVGWRKSASSAWTVSEGVLRNSSMENNKVAEGAIAHAIDLSPFTNIDSGDLTLQFEYTTGETNERIHVHLWGYVETTNTPAVLYLMNLGAQGGNAWQQASTNLISAFNLGKPNGVFLPTAGVASDAAAILTGSTGEQSYSNTFDLSTFTPPASNTVVGYDILVLGLAREIGGTALPEASIRNIVLSVPGGDTLLEFVQEQPVVDLMADPDGDSLINLYEYALGGNPTNGLDVGLMPYAGAAPNGSPEYIYFRRRDHAPRGLVYTVERGTNLLGSGWSTNGCTEVGSAPVDSEFESVTNELQSGEAVFGRLRISLEE